MEHETHAPLHALWNCCEQDPTKLATPVSKSKFIHRVHLFYKNPSSLQTISVRLSFFRVLFTVCDRLR